MLKKIIKIVFSRIFVVVIGILLQLGWVAALVWGMSVLSNFAETVISVLSIVLVLWIVNKRINPSYKLTWTILILVIPFFGVTVYGLFGKSRIAGKMSREFEGIRRSIADFFKENEETRKELLSADRRMSNQSYYIREFAGFPLHKNTKTEYFSVGEDMFAVMLEELQKAKHFIFMEYFIINGGKMWSAILDILEKKVKEGVDVRLIYDDMGCVTTLPYRFYKDLQAVGIKCASFNPVRPILNIILNNRDHRKILVIDGCVGFTGGLNLADEYINEEQRYGHWKDTGIVLRGEGVWNFTMMFLQMWSVITRMRCNFMEFGPHAHHHENFESDGFVQPYSDTPLDNEVVGENVYLNIINHAKDYVYICTPYLIIDNEMMTALCLAAKNGINVRIITPGIPDKKIVFLLTQSYYGQLLESGVKIYEYTPGFLHAKSFVCDDEVAVVGTINLDYRSLYLHFECGVWMYRSAAVLQIKQDMQNMFPLCKQMPVNFGENRNVAIRAAQNILRLFAPMM